MKKLDPSKDQTAHISLQSPAISKSGDENRTGSAIVKRRPPDHHLYVVLRPVPFKALGPSDPSGAPALHLCAAGEGLSTDRCRGPQGHFWPPTGFFALRRIRHLSAPARATNGVRRTGPPQSGALQRGFEPGPCIRSASRPSRGPPGAILGRPTRVHRTGRARLVPWHLCLLPLAGGAPPAPDASAGGAAPDLGRGHRRAG